MLLLRTVFAGALLVQGIYYLREPDPTLATGFVGVLGLASGALLVIGFLTPVVCLMVGLAGIGIGFSLFPSCSEALFASTVPLVFALAILVALAILGPGAFSVDARLFGRREIIIPLD